LSARHSARFFRDSTLVADVDYSNVPRNSVITGSGPASSDDAFSEKPSFHKIHRNNIQKAKEVVETVQVPSPLNLQNDDALYVKDKTILGQTLASSGSSQVETYLTSSRQSGSTFSSWVRFDDSVNAHVIFSVGRTSGSPPFVQLEKVYRGSPPVGHALKLEIAISRSLGQGSNIYAAIENSLDDGKFHHIAVSYDTTLTASGVSFYIDGVKKTTSEIQQQGTSFWTTKQGPIGFNFRGFGNVDGTRYYTLLDTSEDTNGSSSRLTGAIDQTSVWLTKLTDLEVASLYNGSNPYNITSSSVYTNNSASLHAWWQFESSIDEIDLSNPGTFGSTNKIIDSSGNNHHLFPIAASGSTMDLEITGNLFPVPFSGDSSTTPEQRVSYICEQKYDNANLHHQIPRSDRQYSWIAHSITHTGTCEPRYSGFMKTDNKNAPFYEVTGVNYPFFDYVSSSQTTASIFQNTTRMDLLVLDKTGSEMNTIGESTISASLVPTFRYADRLNALLIHRGDTYGWNWRAFHQQDHPVLHREHKQNLLTVLDGETLREFNNPPVSFCGKPVTINYDDLQEQNNVTIKTTFNNEKIYFMDRKLNQLTFNKQDDTYTTLELIADSFPINWVLYSECLFPSERNLFGNTNVRSRNNYAVNFWKDSREDRTTFSLERTSFDDIARSQSVWLLDEPTNFLTSSRTAISGASGGYHLGTYSTAGELQNEYIFNPVETSLGDKDKIEKRRVGAHYNRKHMLSSLHSSVNRTNNGTNIPVLGPFADKQEEFLGEAMWQAGEGAFVNENGTLSPKPSKPWYQEYSDYVEDINTISKDEAVVAEFRISEMIRQYKVNGVFSDFNTNELSVNGSDGDSSPNFYTTYTNSDFLRHFSEIKDITELSGKEVKLRCEATIKFMPYKGFYPAQRTLDLLTEFSRSYSSGLTVQIDGLGSTGSSYSTAFSDGYGAAVLPVIKPLFAPGVIYNSIKSGIAVDYPIMNQTNKYNYANFTSSAGACDENWMILPNRDVKSAGGVVTFRHTASNMWDVRVPFEAALEPGKYLDKILLVDNEPHPSASATMSASLDSSMGDGIYELAARNFFGESSKFFLRDSGFSRVESGLIQDGLVFNSGSVFGARLKIRRSHNGQRYYNRERDSFGKFGPNSDYYTMFGAKAYATSSSGLRAVSGSYPLPQDPRNEGRLLETFTMYSRPSAFGPAVSGRTKYDEDKYVSASLSGTMDSLEGYNWSFTPPYYNGECWVDFIFRPTPGTQYSLEQILSEIKTIHRRVDPGFVSGSGSGSNTVLIHSQMNFGAAYTPDQGAPIYGGLAINANAMKLDSSLNLFGIETVPKKRKDKFGNTVLEENQTAGKKWVIQPKWETPMLNFNRYTSTTSSTITPLKYTIPANNDKSVPRGMWHQFGEIPHESSIGVFLEMGDIPKDWLKYHYDVIVNDSEYNNNDVTTGNNVADEMKSLADLFGFSKDTDPNTQQNNQISLSTSPNIVRLGELADKRTINEAIIAIPYVSNVNEEDNKEQQVSDYYNKKFISISKERFNAALKESSGTEAGSSLEAAGASIRSMVEKMKKYVLPPQFDFINFDNIDPIVMYFFEFSYELDKDDLSYIWQNLAPRNYTRVQKQVATVSHDLLNSELLEEKNIIDNDNLRWMVFKVKQKAKGDYYKLVKPQAGQVKPASETDLVDTDKDSNYLRFNWPYDYVSIVETAKMGMEVLFKEDE